MVFLSIRKGSACRREVGRKDLWRIYTGDDPALLD
jgi:hypothetical protein